MPAYFKRRTVEFKLRFVLILERLFGAAFSVLLFIYFKNHGQVDFLVQLCYVIFLGIIGGLMFIESPNALLKSGKPSGIKKGRERNFTQSLPFKYQFRMSGLYISAIPRLMAGIFVGILSAITGIGGGFIMAPAMFDILGMPTKVVVGVSLVKIIFVAAFTTLLNAITNYTVDMVLAVLILVGSFIGVQVAIQPRTRLKAKKLRILSAFMVLAISGKLAIDLLLQPAELYSISAAEGY